MGRVKVKVKLKENVTEEEFLMTTFNKINEINVGRFDMYKMKNEPLEGYNNETILDVYIPCTNEDCYINFGYEAGYKDIWEVIE